MEITIEVSRWIATDCPDCKGTGIVLGIEEPDRPCNGCMDGTIEVPWTMYEHDRITYSAGVMDERARWAAKYPNDQEAP